MFYSLTLISVFEVLLEIVPMLLAVAYITVAERKTMASMQRRLGPNAVGYYGLLQAFADALKLLLKEYVAPTQSNIVLFFLGPVITLVFSLLGYAVIPYGPSLFISDFSLGILYMLAVSSLATYGILLAGWSANSKYAFLGSLRSTAQLISYELVLTSAILLVVMLTSNFNLSIDIEAQRAVWFIFPLFPILLIFFIGSVAETNRAPFDLAEAESELVSGFMTEHAAVIFVFFFLAEYGSILLMCILTSVLFGGGYLNLTFIDIDLENFISVIETFNWNFYSNDWWLNFEWFKAKKQIHEILNGGSGAILLDWVFFYAWIIYLILIIIISIVNNTLLTMLDIIILILEEIYNVESLEMSFSHINSSDSQHFDGLAIEGLFYGLIIGLKSALMVFIFIWVRAAFPRIRFDQLMSFCWTVLLPLVFAFIILIPCILYTFNVFIVNVNVF